MRSRLGHGCEGISRGKQARAATKLRRGGTAVIATTVEPLVVRSGIAGQAAERWAAAQDPFSPIRVEPHALAVGRAEAATALPDLAGHCRASKVVEQPGGTDIGHRLFVHASEPCRATDDLCD